MTRTADVPEFDHATIAWRDNGVATVAIRNSGPLNILSSAVMEDMRDAIVHVSADPCLRVLIVRGEGEKAFVAGADVHEMVDLDAQGATAFITRLYDLCEAVRNCPVPVIARLCGYCLGGGLQLAASCDIRLAAEETKFGMPEVRVGMASIIHAALLPRLAGSAEAKWLLLTGEQIGTEEALRCGLVTRVVAKEQLDRTIDAAAAAILACGPNSVREQKWLLRRWEGEDVAEKISGTIPLFAEAYALGEPQRYLRAFIEARSSTR
ncbi:MAG: enoyl-CoA hydratase [Xanthobacteraceae bacterium]